MKHIFVDYEMHPLADRYDNLRKICSMESIEIGAVMLNNNMEKISDFRSYIRQQFNNEIYSKYRTLTGIRECDIADAPDFRTVMKQFCEWCESFNDPDYSIYAWSNSDYDHMRSEMCLKSVPVSEFPSNVLHRWIDVQAEYDRLIGAHNPTALHRALESVGITFSGKMHDALYDADNTAGLHVMMQDKKSFMQDYSNVREYLNRKEDTVTLGDLFNLSLLQQATA